MQSPMIPGQFPVHANPAVLGGATFSARTKAEADSAFVVLHVDRRRREARAVRMTLGAPGTRLQTPISSAEALACIRTGTLDLIVDTRELPIPMAMAGPSRDASTAAIALSSRAALESGTRLRREGFDVYYLPPVVLTELINDVAGWLAAADAA